MQAVKSDWRTADLGAADRAMLGFATRLTREPWATREADLAVLRGHGFDDVAIHDIVQVTALFNYFCRLADGLGVDPEEGWVGDRR